LIVGEFVSRVGYISHPTLPQPFLQSSVEKVVGADPNSMGIGLPREFGAPNTNTVRTRYKTPHRWCKMIIGLRQIKKNRLFDGAESAYRTQKKHGQILPCCEEMKEMRWLDV